MNEYKVFQIVFKVDQGVHKTSQIDVPRTSVAMPHRFSLSIPFYFFILWVESIVALAQ